MKLTKFSPKVAIAALALSGMVALGGCTGTGSEALVTGDNGYTLTKEDLYTAMKQAVGEDAVRQELLLNVLKKDVSEEEYKQLQDEAKKQLDTQLSAQGPNNKISDSQKAAYEKGLILQSLIKESIKKSVDTSEEAIKYYYETKYQPKLKAKHILVETEDKANEIIKKLQDGADFTELAKAESKDPGTGQNGGELGEFDANTMVKEFTEAVQNGESGKLVEKPVKSQFGYHVIFVENNGKQKPPLEEVKEQIKKSIQEEKMMDSKYVDEFLYNKLKNANLTIKDDSLKNVIESMKPVQQETPQAPIQPEVHAAPAETNTAQDKPAEETPAESAEASK